jgi:GT2 family glycosyltransferase
MRTAVITLIRGRHDHLRRQQTGLAAATRPPDHYIVVAMGDPDVEAVVAGQSPACDVVHLPTTAGRLPLARARNRGAEHALDAGADLLVFLDADCIPGPRMVERYEQTAGRALLCGTVSYLPPPAEGGYRMDRLADLGRPHPARPVPARDELIKDGDHRLFWSLSFAVTGDAWHRIGGFGEEYTGYGGEDTDFGQRARQAGIPLWWVGGAPAYHQHHPTTSPPVEHLEDILRNAKIFHDRWGWWPMPGWLREFEDLGLIRHDPRTNEWTRPRPPGAAGRGEDRLRS